jgi:hypothetical protein
MLYEEILSIVVDEEKTHPSELTIMRPAYSFFHPCISHSPVPTDNV